MSFDYDKLISQIKNLELPKEQEVNQICQKAKEIFLKESNLLHFLPHFQLVHFYNNL